MILTQLVEECTAYYGAFRRVPMVDWGDGYGNSHKDSRLSGHNVYGRCPHNLCTGRICVYADQIDLYDDATHHVPPPRDYIKRLDTRSAVYYDMVYPGDLLQRTQDTFALPRRGEKFPTVDGAFGLVIATKLDYRRTERKERRAGPVRQAAEVYYSSINQVQSHYHEELEYDICVEMSTITMAFILTSTTSTWRDLHRNDGYPLWIPIANTGDVWSRGLDHGSRG